MMTVNLAIGTITPPVAVNLYVAARIADIPIEEVSRLSRAEPGKRPKVLAFFPLRTPVRGET